MIAAAHIPRPKFSIPAVVGLGAPHATSAPKPGTLVTHQHRIVKAHLPPWPHWRVCIRSSVKVSARVSLARRHGCDWDEGALPPADRGGMCGPPIIFTLFAMLHGTRASARTRSWSSHAACAASTAPDSNSERTTDGARRTTAPHCFCSAATGRGCRAAPPPLSRLSDVSLHAAQRRAVFAHATQQAHRAVATTTQHRKMARSNPLQPYN